jgi:protein SCO1/2
MGIGLMSVVVSAQGNAPGLRPEPGLPSQQTPTPLSNVSFEQRLNEQLPLDLPFRNEAGQTVKLGDYFGRKPVILTFVYYECPMLCTEVLNGLESSLRVLNETIGKEFDVVTVSFDPRETSVLAAGKKKAYLERYKRPEAERGWHFLTGDQASIDALTKAAGFHYFWDEASHQFAHASGIIVATPAMAASSMSRESTTRVSRSPQLGQRMKAIPPFSHYRLWLADSVPLHTGTKSLVLQGCPERQRTTLRHQLDR